MAEEQFQMPVYYRVEIGQEFAEQPEIPMRRVGRL
jgi:hypothetical protein